VVELAGQTVAVEKSLQSGMERYLDALHTEAVMSAIASVVLCRRATG